MYHICVPRQIRNSLSLNLSKQIAVALVISKLDHCDSLFHNMPEKDIARLLILCVQNCLARVVSKPPRFSLSVPILKRLHLLLVKFRINFKIFTMTFRTLKDNQPAYLADLLVRPKCSTYLRSTNSNSLLFPVYKTRLGQELSLHLAQPYETPCMCPYVMPKQCLHSGNCLNLLLLKSP